MEKKQNKLDQLKGDNPFKLPEGYMEGLTSQIMSQLPEKHHQPARTVTLMDRIRPWLYMAAVFAGLLVCFKVFFNVTGTDVTSTPADSLLVHTTISPERSDMLVEDEYFDEDDEYMEYIENQYASYILAAETTFSE